MKQSPSPPELKVEESDIGITICFPSGLALVDAALTASRTWLQEQDVAHARPILVAVRELVVNAVIHGNDSNLAKHVTCELRPTSGGSIRISVEDEGEGFDPDLIDMRLPGDPKGIRKRGLILVRALSKTLVFDATRGRVMAYLDPEHSKDEAPRLSTSAPNEFSRLVDYELGCANRYGRSASLVMVGSGNGPVHYESVIGGILRCSDSFVELDESATVLMGETGSDEALHAVSRYKAAINGSTDLRYAVASFPQDGRNAVSLLVAAHERLCLARQQERGAVVWET